MHDVESDERFGAVLDANAEACAMLECSREEIVGRSPLEFLAEESQWEAREILRNLRLQEQVTAEIALRSAEGRRLSVEVGISLMRMGDREVAAWVMRDATARRRFERMEVITNTLAHRLSGMRNAKQAAMAILEAADELLGWDAAHMNLYPPSQDFSYPLVNVDLVDGEHRDFPLPPTTPVSPMSRRVLNDGALLLNFADDHQKDGFGLVSYGRTEHLSRSLMFVPIRRGSENFGVFSIQSYTTGKYTEEDLRTLQVLSDHCSAALDRIYAEESLRREVTIAERLFHLGKTLAEAVSPQDAAAQVLETADGLMTWDAAFISLYNRETDSISQIIAIDTIDGQRTRVQFTEIEGDPSPLYRHVLEHGAELVRRGEGAEMPFRRTSPFGDTQRRSESIMFAPMRSAGGPVGVVSVQSYRRDAYAESDLALLQTLADHCSGALTRTFAETKLRLSEERLRLILGQLPTLLFAVDRTLRFSLIEGERGASIGLVAEKHLGAPFADYIGTSDRNSTALRMQSLALEGVSGNYELEREGTVFHCYVEPLRDATGRTIGCVNVGYDVTERKMAELALTAAHEELEARVAQRTEELTRANEQLRQEVAERRNAEDKLERSLSLLRATLDSTTDGIVMVDVRGRLVNYNSRWIQMWRVPPPMVVGAEVDAIIDVISPWIADPERFRLRVHRLRSEGVPESFDVLELRDGRIFECYSKLRTSAGKREGRVWSFRDVTQRRRAEQAQARAEAIYRAAIANAEGVPYQMHYGVDAYDFMGEGILQLIGISADKVDKWTIHEHKIESIVLDPEFQGSVYEYQELFRLGKINRFRLDMKMRTADGRIKWINDCSVPIKDEHTGKVLGSIGILQDVTSRKLAEEQARSRERRLVQAEKLVALGTLVSGVAHEINNPNNFIMLNVPLLKDAWLNIQPILDDYIDEHGDFLVAGIEYSEMRETVPELFNSVLDGARRIQNIVQELGDFARPQSEEINQAVDINGVVKSALILLQNTIRKSTASFEAFHGDGIPRIRGNAQRLEQVVINLIQNACQALTDKGQAVRVRTYFDVRDSAVVLRVEDEGRGIPEDTMAHIMDPFFTTKRDSGGTGLGLSISNTILHDHGGTLEFTSEEGRGTIATVRIPTDPDNVDDSGNYPTHGI